MKYKQSVWLQLKGKQPKEFIDALNKDDNWTSDEIKGAEYAYRHKNGRHVVIHYHPNCTYGRNQLKYLLGCIAWTEQEMRRLKFIK